MSESTVTLYRPVGARERQLSADSGFRRFSPRLPEQRIFYLVCNEQYAVELAERWNAKRSGQGFVTLFRVRTDFLARYQTHIALERHHEECWIPAAKLGASNDAIVGVSEVVRELSTGKGGQP